MRIPGEGREATRRERLDAGVPVHPGLWKELAAIARELDIALPDQGHPPP